MKKNLAGILTAAFAAVFGTYPALAKPCAGAHIQLVVPFAAGTSIDSATRLVAGAMEKSLGQPLVIFNMPGANGRIAAEYIYKAAPDGCTLGSFSSAPIVMLPAEKKVKGESFPYDPTNGFSPIGGTFEITFVLAVRKPLPSSMSAFVEYAGAHENVSIGVSYALADVTLSLMQSHFGVKLQAVPYRSGDTTSLADLLGGRIDGSMMTLSVALPYIVEERLAPLCVIAKSRHPSLPATPTADELGLTELDAVRTWLGILGPAGMPQELVLKFNSSLNQALADPSVIASLQKLGITARPATPTELSQQIKSQVAAWEKLIRDKVVRFE